MRARHSSFVTLIMFLAPALLVLSGCGVNKIPTLYEQLKAAWSQVLNEYQHRARAALLSAAHRRQVTVHRMQALSVVTLIHQISN